MTLCLTLRYRGLRGRTLAVASPNRAPSLAVEQNLFEDEVAIPPISFRLGAIDDELIGLVKRCCEPLFVVFDFATLNDAIYRQIVTDFAKGRII